MDAEQKIKQDAELMLSKKREGIDFDKQKENLKKAVSPRDKAMEKIKQYQETTGEPTEAEQTQAFFDEAGIDLNIDEFLER